MTERKLGRPKSPTKRVIVSSYIKQDTFMELAKQAVHLKISISRIIANILEHPDNTGSKEA